MSQGSLKLQLKPTIVFFGGPHLPRRHHEQLVSWLFAEAEVNKSPVTQEIK